MQNFRDDLIAACKTLTRNLRFTLTAGLIFGCGSAAAVTLFSTINFYFVRPLPVARPAELVRVGIIGRMSGVPTTMPYEIFKKVQATSSAFPDAIAFSAGDMVVEFPSEELATRRFIGVTSDNYFTFLGITPAAGRLYDAPTIDAGTPAFVLSYQAWQRYFRGETSAIGRTIHLNGQPFRVLGVAPESFHGTEAFIDVDGYMAAQSLLLLVPPGLRNAVHGVPGTYRVMARLRADVSPTAAASALASLADQIDPQRLSATQSTRFVVMRELRSRPDMALSGVVEAIAIALTTLVLLLFALSCVSVASLMILRFIDRRGEFAMRGALGATPRRILTLCAFEGGVLGLLGSTVGLVLAQPLIAWLGGQHFGTDSQSHGALVGLRPDAVVYVGALLLLAGASTLTALLAGHRLRTMAPGDALKESGQSIAAGRHRAPLRRLLVGLQVGVSVVLLAASWMLHSAAATWAHVDLGFRSAGVASVSVDLVNSGYDRPRGEQVLARWLENVRATPGVAAVALTQHVPLSPNPAFTNLRSAVSDAKRPAIREIVSPDYFRVLDVPLVTGRAFDATDTRGRPLVAIVNQTLARRVFGSESVIGRRVLLGSSDTLFAEIIGVARDAKYLFANESPTDAVYVPHAQVYSAEMSMLLRAGTTREGIEAARGALARIDSHIGAFDEAGLSEIVAGSSTLTLMRLAAAFSEAVALIAVLQVFAGLYAIVAFDVLRRRRELGLRVVLGATTRGLLGMVTARSMTLSGAGIAIALGPTAIVLRRLSALVHPPASALAVSLLVAGACVLVGSALIAALAGRQIFRVDPAEALRNVS